MRKHKSFITITGKEIPVMIESYESTGETLRRLGEEKTLNLINYAFSLIQRAKHRADILALPPKKRTLRGKCRKVKT